MTLSFLKRNHPLILIIFLGVVLRAWGIFYDMPLSSSVGDEMRLLAGGLKMVSEKSLIPIAGEGQGIYFPLMYYVYAVGVIIYTAFLLFFGGFKSISQIKDSVILSVGDWLVVGRSLSIIMGAASILLIYLISQKIFNKKSISYLAALFFALSPLNSILSHFGKIWPAQTFFMLLSVYFFLHFWHGTAIVAPVRKVFWSAVLIISSFAVNIFGLITYPIFLLVVFVYHCNLDWKKYFSFLISRWSIIFHGILVAGLALVLFLAKDALAIYKLGWKIFIHNSTDKVITGEAVFWDLPRWEKVGLTFNMLLQFETVLFILLVPAFWLLYKKNRQIFYFLLPIFLTFFIFLGPPILTATRPRYLSFLVPFMVLPVAYLAQSILSWLNKKNVFLTIIVFFIFIIPSLFINLRYDYLLQQNSTKLALYNWIEQNLKPGEKVLIYGMYLLQDIIPDQQLVNLVKEYSPNYYSTRLKYLDNKLPNYLDGGYGVYSTGFVCEWPREVVEKINFDYIVTSRILEGPVWIPGSLMACDNIPIYKLTPDQLILHLKVAPFFTYTIESGVPLESYRPLWQIKKLGADIYIYKISNIK